MKRTTTAVWGLLLMIGFASLPAQPDPHEAEPSPELNSAGATGRLDEEAEESPEGLAKASEAETAPPARTAETVQRPAYRNVRFDEDWSVLANVAQRTGWDRFKYIPLGGDGAVFLSLGGQLRGRVEDWRDFGFGGPGKRNDTYGLFRLRLHGDLVVGPHFRFFVEGKSALATGRELPGGNRVLDTDAIDLQNALVDLSAPLGGEARLIFRAGRQELEFGRQRLVSPLDWSNTRRTFDGFRGILRGNQWQVHGFWSRLVRTRKYHFNPHDTGTDFYGLYGSGNITGRKLTLDAYWLALEREGATFGTLTAAERRHSLGARLSGAASAFGFDIESAYQFGTHGSDDISAFMLTSEVTWSFAAPLSPVAVLALDYASGDKDPDDQDLGTFNQLFPLGHAYLGFADFVGRQNVLDFNQRLSIKPFPKAFTVRFDSHFFWRASRNDALYNAGGAVLRPGSAGDSKRIGTELDLLLTYQVNRHLSALAGYSHFFAGEFVRESGPDEDVDFFYGQLQYTF